MSTATAGSQLALDLYALLRDTDPARWRDGVESAARQRLAAVKRQAAELLGRADADADAVQEALSGPVARVALVLEEHGRVERLEQGDRRAQWMRLRERLLPAYESLARVLRAQAIHVPALRPTNWYRSAFHVISAVTVLLLLEVVLSPWGTVLASGGFALVCWTLETGRALSRSMNDVLMRFRFFQLIIHPHERHRVNSATWYATALFILSLVSPPFASALAVAVLGAGDPIAAFVGRRWGRVTLVHGRTLEGTLAFVAVSAVVAFVVLLIWHPMAGVPALFVVAGVAAVFGAVVELFSLRLDDNFTIPLAAAAGASLAASLLGIAG